MNNGTLVLPSHREGVEKDYGWGGKSGGVGYYVGYCGYVVTMRVIVVMWLCGYYVGICGCVVAI